MISIALEHARKTSLMGVQIAKKLIIKDNRRDATHLTDIAASRLVDDALHRRWNEARDRGARAGGRGGAEGPSPS